MQNSETPSEWGIAKLGDVCSKPQYGYTTKSSVEGKVKFLRTTDITKGNLVWDKVPYCLEEPDDIAKYQLHVNDIVISRAGSIGFSALLESPPNNAVFASYLIRFKPSNLINPRFIKRFLESDNYWVQLSERAAGNAVQNVNAKKLADLNLPIPPLPEQKQIAATLDQLLARVEAIKTRLDAIPALLKRFRQSVLAAAVSGRLTEEWRNSQKLKPVSNEIFKFKKVRSERLDKEVLEGNKETKRLCRKIAKHTFAIPSNTSIPETWAWTSFMDSMEKVVDCHNKTAPYVDEGIHLIRTSDIRNGQINLSSTRFVDQPTYEYWSRRLIPAPGDILFTREAPMGEVGIVPPATRLCMGQRMMLLRPISEFTNPKYVLFNIMSLPFQERMNESAMGTGVKHLRVADVESLTYPLPPIEEQTQIVHRVEQLFAFADQIEQRLAAARGRVEHLTQSILARAFRGELTAQWRADHPELISGEHSAQALLARIRAERAAAPVKKRARRT